MTVTATKKFSEYDLTSVYADCTDIDEATQSLLYDWFQYRTVCDDEKFLVFYRRKLMRCEAQYRQLLRLEHSDFDPLVASYHERRTQTTNSGSSSMSSETDTTGSNTDTETKNLTDLTTVDRDTTDSRSFSNTGSTSNKDVSASKANPQSIAYSGTTAGNLPALDWGYMSAQAQNENTGSSTQTGTSSGTGTDDSTTTTTHTGTDGRVGSTTGNSQTEQTTTTANTGVVKEQTTGRDGLTPQEAFLKAREWIVISDAFDWLKAELNSCFLGIIEV